MRTDKHHTNRVLMKRSDRRRLILAVLLSLILGGCTGGQVRAEPCMEITLTGTMGGPPAFGGLAHAGTLIKYGDTGNACGDVLLQFDTGRGTQQALSKLGTSSAQLDAVFLTHMHSDHSEGLAELAQLRWHFLAGPLDVVCSADVNATEPPPERTLSCSNFVNNIAEPLLRSGEIAQRLA